MLRRKAHLHTLHVVSGRKQQRSECESARARAAAATTATAAHLTCKRYHANLRRFTGAAPKQTSSGGGCCSSGEMTTSAADVGRGCQPGGRAAAAVVATAPEGNCPPLARANSAAARAPFQYFLLTSVPLCSTRQSRVIKLFLRREM